jgi:hypothetical protein
LDTSNSFVEVTKTAVLGSEFTLNENNEDIIIKLILISIKVDVKEEQYVPITSANRYNLDDGVYTQANDGEYLNVGADYYYIHESNRYNYNDGSYVLAWGGNYLRVSTKAIYMNVTEGAIKDWQGNEGIRVEGATTKFPFGEYERYLITDTNTPEVEFLDPEEEEEEVAPNRIWFDLARKSSGIREGYNDEGTYWRHDNLISQTDSYVEVLNESMDFGKKMTFAVVFRYIGSGTGYLVDSDTFKIQIKNNKLYVVNNEASIVVIDGMVAGQLYRVTTTINGTNLSVYVNDQEKTNYVLTTVITDDVPNLRLLSSTVNLTVYLGNVMIYDRA